MRRIAGAVCLASFILCLVFAGCYVYIVLAPFFRGAEVRIFGDDLERIPDQLAVTKSDEAVLRGFAIRYGHGRVERGWDTIHELTDTWTTRKVWYSVGGSNLAWLAVADKQGRVVASIPEDLAKSMGRVHQPTEEGWAGAVGHRGGRLVGIGVESIYKRKKSGDYAVIGSVAAGYNMLGEIATIPPETRVHAWISPLVALWLSAASLLLCAILLPVWVAMDADWRGMRGGAWAVLVVVTGVIGFAAYLLARLAPPRQCPNCGEMVQSGYKRCPACGVSLLAKCPKCGRKLRPGWQFCPRCTEEQPKEPEQPKPTPQPEPITIQPQPDFESPLLADEAPAEVAPALPSLSHSTLDVTVLDAATSTPIAAATVSISGPTSREGRTSTTGKFEARSIVTGPYSVTASAKGYRAAQAGVELEPDDCVPLQLALEALSGAIDGRVLDRAALQPVSGARVFTDSARLERSTTTNADGFFALAEIPPGPYTIRASADGFAPQTRLAEVDPDERVTLGFALEAATEAIEEESTDAVQ